VEETGLAAQRHEWQTAAIGSPSAAVAQERNAYLHRPY